MREGEERKSRFFFQQFSRLHRTAAKMQNRSEAGGDEVVMPQSLGIVPEEGEESLREYVSDVQDVQVQRAILASIGLSEIMYILGTLLAIRAMNRSLIVTTMVFWLALTWTAPR